MPSVDIFAVGFLLGWSFGVGLMGVLYARQRERERRRRAFGLRRHPAFRSHV